MESEQRVRELEEEVERYKAEMESMGILCEELKKRAEDAEAKSTSEKEGYRRLVEKSMEQVQTTKKKLQEVEKQVQSKQREIITLKDQFKKDLEAAIQKERELALESAPESKPVNQSQDGFEMERIQLQQEIEKWMLKAEKSAQLLLDEDAAHDVELHNLRDQIDEKNADVEAKDAYIRELEEKLEAATKQSQKEGTPPKGAIGLPTRVPKERVISPSSLTTPKTKGPLQTIQTPETPDNPSKQLVYTPTKGDDIDSLLAKCLQENGLQSLQITRVSPGIYDILEPKSTTPKKYQIKSMGTSLAVKPPSGTFIKFDTWAKTIKPK
eukprot:TRINITY_DN10122_c0_g1_i2.p1 TRINITY_DN10122_c0_g1~~TRINITY_DN10122_c0_g1_i2.p1  ORF type:complete len:325 (+),score=103.66 TRINITY_DN10122_c0_g1_i2:53-1027(+)